MKSNNKVFLHKLTDEEKTLLGYEFSKERMFLTLVEYQIKFNDVYRDFINIFRKIFFLKKTKNNLMDELSNLIEELAAKEQELLKKHKTIYFYKQLSKLNLSNTDIYLEFTNKDEEQKFFRKLNNRKDSLIKYKEQITKLEDLKRQINSIYTKITSISCMDILNK